jgi:hypothetical protein
MKSIEQRMLKVEGKNHQMKFIFVVSILLFIFAGLANAGEAEVIKVKIKSTDDNTYRFDVTVRHKDEGWNHYVDKWDVVAPDGTVLGTRVLYHPHVDEQPFTRRLNNIKIPPGIENVTVRAHDSVHKYGGRVVTVKVPR